MEDASHAIARRTALGLIAGAASVPLLPSAALAYDGPPNNTYRVPESRFGGLNFPYTPRYYTWNGYRIAFYVAGSGTAGTVLLMHGNPTWAYLYHEMIPTLVGRGYRVVLPDLIGFGRSDKPLDRSWYSYGRLTKAMSEWFIATGLRDVNLFCQDWGGLIGLRIVDLYPDRFRRVCTSNTALPFGQTLPPAFVQWRDQFSEIPQLTASAVVEAETVTSITATDAAAYDAPFGPANGADTLVAMRVLPKLVPTTGDSGDGAYNRLAFDRLRKFQKPWLCLWGSREPYTQEFYDIFRNNIAGARLPGVISRHTNQINGGHFIQEDAGAELANRFDDFIRHT